MLSFDLPYTAFLRPVLLLFRYRKLTRSAVELFSTLIKSLKILTLVVLVLLMASIANVALFNGSVRTTLEYRSFDNIISSFLQTFVLMITTGKDSRSSCAATHAG
jgi:TRAP-type C4-dicarboxylate transport system permease large subunit